MTEGPFAYLCSVLERECFPPSYLVICKEKEFIQIRFPLKCTLKISDFRPEIGTFFSVGGVNGWFQEWYNSWRGQFGDLDTTQSRKVTDSFVKFLSQLMERQQSVIVFLYCLKQQQKIHKDLIRPIVEMALPNFVNFDESNPLLPYRNGRKSIK